MTNDTNQVPRTCQAHLVIKGGKPCREQAAGADPLSANPYLLCQFHMWRIGAASKRPPKQQVVTKIRHVTVETPADESLRADIARRDEKIARLEAQIAELTRKPQKRPVDQDAPGVVYFARTGGGYIKIGWTADLGSRMRKYPPDWSLVATMPGTRRDEAREHKRFAHLRTHGREWYPLAAQIIERVDSIKREHGEPQQPAFMARPVSVPRPHSTRNRVTPRTWSGSRTA